MSKTKYDWKYWTIRDKVNDLTKRLMIQGERLKIEALQKKKRKEITNG
jgi:regulation of enolase protein 1 (concanavalin A-like superfamily)|tara:strand:+ start:1871 stop:2014 length:144 start_codon:yes stop_codon:yes gene_type:complete